MTLSTLIRHLKTDTIHRRIGLAHRSTGRRPVSRRLLSVEALEGRTLLSAGPELLKDINGLVFFAAADGIHGRELWKSDGTAAGTSLVKDITPGNSGLGPADLTV